MAGEKKIIRNKSKVLYSYLHTDYGIVSGLENPASIGCTMYILESEEAATIFSFNQWHAGHKIYGHGGLSAAVLDEVMGYSNHVYDYYHGGCHVPVFTGEATYRYLRPIPLNEPMYAFARVEKSEGRKRFITGEILDNEGNVMVVSKSIYITTDALGTATKVEVKLVPVTDEDPKEL